MPTPLPPTVAEEASPPLPGETDVAHARLTDTAARAPQAALPQVPGYEVLGRLGHGGMGVVYEARDRALGRRVALKMVRDGVLATAEQLARFQAEARAVARLSHPNVVQIYEIGEHNGQPWFALELVEGGSLAQRLAVVPFPPTDAAALVESLARAVHHAHEQGIVHRDLKPANVLLTRDGQPKITDFGLAKELEAEVFLTHTASGALLGTPSYMAPEQAWGQSRAVGPSADIYALGAILYECLTGRPPFLAAKLLEVLELVRSHEPVSPRALNAEVPRDLETICLKCLAKEPWKRYATAQELADDLARWRRGEPILARRATRAERALKWARRRPAAAALLAVTVAAAAVIGIGLWKSARQADESERKDRAAKEELRRERYPATLAQVEDALAAGQMDEARRLLEEECPAELRGWEWRYLKGLAEGRLTPIVPRAHDGPLSSVGPVAAGGRFVTLGQNGTLRLWEPATGRFEERRGLPVRDGALTSLAADAEGRLLAWAVMRPVPDRLPQPKDAPGEARRGGRRGAAALAVRLEDKGPVQKAKPALDESQVVVWGLAAGRPLGAPLPFDLIVNDLAVSADGKRLAVACGRLTTRVTPPEALLPQQPKVRAALWRDETLVFAGDALALRAPVGEGKAPRLDAGRLVVRDLDGGKELLRLDFDLSLVSVAWRPDGQALAVASAVGEVRIVRLGGAVTELPADFRAWSVAFDPAGKRLAAAAVWDADNGGRLFALRDHTAPITALAWSPDGSRLVTASADRTAVVRDAATGRRLLTLPSQGPLAAAAFDPTGQVLLTADDGGRLIFWGGHDPARRGAVGDVSVPGGRDGGPGDAIAPGPPRDRGEEKLKAADEQKPPEKKEEKK
jgi:hypothetical protein